jgi:hypothetical protein
VNQSQLILSFFRQQSSDHRDSPLPTLIPFLPTAMSESPRGRSPDDRANRVSQDDLDNEIAALELLRNDVAGDSGFSYGSRDTEFAMLMFEQEIAAQVERLQDLRLTRAIGRATGENEHVLADIEREHAQARTEGRLALGMRPGNDEHDVPATDMDEGVNSLEEQDIIGQPVPNQAPEHDLSWDEFRAEIPGDLDEENENIPETGIPPTETVPPPAPETECEAQAPGETEERSTGTLSETGTPLGEAPSPAVIRSECCVCLNSFDSTEVINLGCEHGYCMGYLKDLFLRATKDQTLFPPRFCRQEIPRELITAEMSPLEIEEFDQAAIEFSTPNKTYCSNM